MQGTQKIFQQIEEIEPLLTTHGEGTKFVFTTNHETRTSVTQFAYGKLEPGEKIAPHRHASMEEFYYFISGDGEFVIDNKVYNITKGSFIRVPAQAEHRLAVKGGEAVEFVYFGAAITQQQQ